MRVPWHEAAGIECCDGSLPDGVPSHVGTRGITAFVFSHLALRTIEHSAVLEMMAQGCEPLVPIAVITACGPWHVSGHWIPQATVGT
jgi:hypothetical protein